MIAAANYYVLPSLIWAAIIAPLRSSKQTDLLHFARHLNLVCVHFIQGVMFATHRIDYRNP